MKKEDRTSVAIYVLLAAMVASVVGVLTFLFGGHTGDLTAEQLASAIEAQPTECQPIIRARLSKRIIESGKPLRRPDIDSMMRGVEAADCRPLAEQLDALSEPQTVIVP